MDDSLDLVIPPELEAGVYAEWFRPWFTRHQFALDFAAPLHEEGLVLIARVRVPATAAIELHAALTQILRDYELEFGETRRPRGRGEE